jgi:hypothetical protein
VKCDYFEMEENSDMDRVLLGNTMELKVQAYYY